MFKKGLLLLICLYATNVLAAAEFTDIRLYRPFSEAPYQAQAVATHVLKGWCWSQSHADPRPDAWRCMVGDQSFDPCFVKTYVDRTQLICPRSPWQTSAVQITVEKPLDNSLHQQLDMSKDSPWTVELTDGTRCTIITGDRRRNDNNNIRYNCGRKGILLGNFQRCRGLWKARLQSRDGEGERVVEMNRVWF